MRIGIDEISYRRGHNYLMVVVDHDTGRLVWAAGHDRATVQRFFDLLGAKRAPASLTGSVPTDNLIALRLLDRGGHCPPLPGRQTAA